MDMKEELFHPKMSVNSNMADAAGHDNDNITNMIMIT